MFNPLKIFTKLIKSGNEKELGRIQQIVNKVNLLEKNLENLSAEEFPKKTQRLIEEISNGKKLDEVLNELKNLKIAKPEQLEKLENLEKQKKCWRKQERLQ